MNRRKLTRSGLSFHAIGMSVFLLGTITAVLVCGCVKQPRVYRIGVFVGSDTIDNAVDAFRARMGELGFVEGRNVVYDIQKSHGDGDQGKRIAGKFVADKVDLVYAIPGVFALSVKAAAQGTAIPIVFAYGIIEGSDLVDSVRKPGGNITGVRIPATELSLKSLESLLLIKPLAKRILVIYDPAWPPNPPIIEALRSAALSSKVALQEVQITRVQDTPGVLQGLEKAGASMDAVLFMPDLIALSQEASSAIITFADAHRVPVIGGPAALLRSGGSIISAATDIIDQSREAASLVSRIFNGTPAGTIPLMSTEPLLYVNYRKARELGLTIPQGLLKQASEIIQ